MNLLIEMIVEIAADGLRPDVSDATRQMYAKQLESAFDKVSALWTLLLEDQLVSMSDPNFPSEDYFSGKLSGLSSFARMAIGLEDRMSYSDAEILKNVHHYATLVNSIVGGVKQ